MSVCALLGSCVTYSHPNGTKYCGVHIPSGAKAVGFQHLDTTEPAGAVAEPSTSELPPTAPAPNYTQATYIQTSPSCGQGAVVVVAPADQAQLTIAIGAGNGTVTGIGLQQIRAQIKVTAWMSGRYQGSLIIEPYGNQSPR
jgi:hypothetical protein